MRTDRSNSMGFSLIELMIVLVIIAIFAAVAIPQIIEKSRSNKLTDIANMVQQTTSQVRVQAMRSRRAVVVEYDGSTNQMWLNVLEGANCWSAIDNRCVHNLDSDTFVAADDTRHFDLRSAEYQEAGVFMCDAQVSVESSGACAAPAALSLTGQFGLCYSGEGDLWVRPSADDATTCSGTGAVVARANWNKACPYRDGEEISSDGGLLRFNRFDPEGSGGSCADGASATDFLDVTRTVVVPSSGSPHSRVGM